MGQVSERYAEALFGAAVELGCADEVSADLQVVNELAKSFAWFFFDPCISASEKAELLGEVLANQVESLTHEFVAILLKRNHLRYLHEITGYFSRLSDAHFHRVSVFLHVPFSPEPEMLDKLESRFKQKGLIPEDAGEVTLHIVEDKSIIGGFIAFCNGHQIDASIRTQLTKIRRAEEREVHDNVN